MVALRIYASVLSEPAHRPATRQEGFPSVVRSELEVLQHHYFEHFSRLPAVLWDAVPVAEPKIPNKVFAPYGHKAEIDILPL